VVPSHQYGVAENPDDNGAAVRPGIPPDSHHRRHHSTGLVGEAAFHDGFLAPAVGYGQHEPVTASRGRPPVDDLDKAIIEQLQEDGRRAYTQVARSVGLSEAAVRQRVQRMIESGVMQIVAVTDPTAVGFARQAMIGVKVSGDVMAAADALAALPDVEYVVVTAGAIDLLVEVVAEDDAGLLELLNTKIRRLPGVQVTETLIYLRVHKESYQWGTR